MPRPYEEEVAFRERSRRLRSWGLGLLSVAGLLWVWCAVLLLAPYEAEETLGDGRTDTTECESRLFTEGTRPTPAGGGASGASPNGTGPR